MDDLSCAHSHDPETDQLMTPFVSTASPRCLDSCYGRYCTPVSFRKVLDGMMLIDCRRRFFTKEIVCSGAWRLQREREVRRKSGQQACQEMTQTSHLFQTSPFCWRVTTASQEGRIALKTFSFFSQRQCATGYTSPREN